MQALFRGNEAQPSFLRKVANPAGQIGTAKLAEVDAELKAL